MARSDQTNQAEQPSAIDLEPYRRLVELQKEITALAQQNEHAQQKCAKLREGVAARALDHAGTRRDSRRKAGKALAQLPMGLALSGVLSRILK